MGADGFRSLPPRLRHSHCHDQLHTFVSSSAPRNPFLLLLLLLLLESEEQQLALLSRQRSAALPWLSFHDGRDCRSLFPSACTEASRFTASSEPAVLVRHGRGGSERHLLLSSPLLRLFDLWRLSTSERNGDHERCCPYRRLPLQLPAERSRRSGDLFCAPAFPSKGNGSSSAEIHRAGRDRSCTLLAVCIRTCKTGCSRTFKRSAISHRRVNPAGDSQRVDLETSSSLVQRVAAT
mmetsp:Transcript_9811/g.32836  ORF Transcript_9811/g.32836 Transcript_9811/m.32836 type:complete len:236 (+) Transcript_9811:2846-3553(+)